MRVRVTHRQPSALRRENKSSQRAVIAPNPIGCIGRTIKSRVRAVRGVHSPVAFFIFARGPRTFKTKRTEEPRSICSIPSEFVVYPTLRLLIRQRTPRSGFDPRTVAPRLLLRSRGPRTPGHIE